MVSRVRFFVFRRDEAAPSLRTDEVSPGSPRSRPFPSSRYQLMGTGFSHALRYLANTRSICLEYTRLLTVRGRNREPPQSLTAVQCVNSTSLTGHYDRDE